MKNIFIFGMLLIHFGPLAHAQFQYQFSKPLFPPLTLPFPTTPLPSPSPAPEYDILSNKRASLVLPTYTNQEKQLIADQAYYLIDHYYVHRSQKETDFQVDPVARLADLQSKATALSDQDLHTQLQSIFSDLRDLHTNYYFPKPMRCYTSLLPFTVESIELPNGTPVVAVSKVSKVKEAIALAPSLSQVSPGDVLESFSGVDPAQLAKSFEEVGAGANPNAKRRRGLEVLTWRSHSSILLPERDSEHLQFLKPDGSRYAIDLPWVTHANESCLNPSEDDDDAGKGGVDENHLKFNRFFSDSIKKNNFGTLIDTEEGTIHYQLIETELGRFGLIRLDSFSPRDKSTDESLSIIEGLLTNQFQNTKGLILDVRNNGGGEIEYGEQIEQFFTPNPVDTENFQLLANDSNRSYLLAAHTDLEYVPLIDQAKAKGEPLSQAAKLTGLDTANGLGQFYLKPVIVLTNASCFSTCDMFTAGMQDNGIATIVATDGLAGGQTGGGGANVVSYSDFSSHYPAAALNPFQKLPGGQEMRVAWRRSLRVGKNSGKVLEDAGVTADETVQTTLQDLITSDSSLLSVLIKRLNEISANSPNAPVQVQISGASSRIDYQEGAKLSIPLQSSGTDSVDLKFNGGLLSTLPIPGDGGTFVSTLLQFPSAMLSALPDLAKIELLGENKSQTRVWRKILSLRRLPSGELNIPLHVDLAHNNLAPFKLYQTTSEGWSVVNQEMRVGAGPHYSDNTHAEAALFVAVPASGSPRFAFTRELHSEKKFDFFSVSIFQDGKETKILPSESGEIAKSEVTYDLTPFAGKNVEIRFTFDSDAAVTGVGPLISDIGITL